MFSVYQLTDALTASLFGILALWAAASHRHWFVRTAVVGAAVLIMLLIPAYEPLIEFSLEILLVVCGVGIWRRRRAGAIEPENIDERADAPFRMSLETLLLITAVVAVVTAVAARAPHISVYEWYEYAYAGCGAALIVLISVWVVCGQTRWWVRLVALPALVYWAALAMRWLVISRWMLQYWFTAPANISQYWSSILKEGLFAGVSYWVGSIGLGTSILCIWLFLVRYAGWFDPFRDRPRAGQQLSRTDSRQFVARCAACGLFVAIGSYSLWLFYLLMTPAPIPDLASVQPNGYGELLKAGRIVGLYDDSGRVSYPQKSTAELQSAVSKNIAAFEVVHTALHGDCHFPLVRPWGNGNVRWDDDHRALAGLQIALCERETLSSQIGWRSADCEAALDLLRLAFAEDHSNGIDQDNYTLFNPGESLVVNNLWHRRTKLNAQQSTELARTLWENESHRVDWETKLANERIIVENSGFEPHLRAILDRWAGINRNEYAQWNYLQTRTRMRILIVALALHACELDNGRLPTTLDELCPKYLAVIPDDPFDASQPLHYRWPGAEYVLYSVGPNKVDDSVEGNLDMSTRTSDDLSQADEFPPSSDPDQTNTSGAGGPNGGQ